MAVRVVGVVNRPVIDVRVSALWLDLITVRVTALEVVVAVVVPLVLVTTTLY